MRLIGRFFVGVTVTARVLTMIDFTAGDSAEQGARATAGPGAMALPEVIARIPDLASAREHSAAHETKLNQRRLLGTKPGMMILGGGGLLLFIAALVPFVFSKKAKTDSPDATAQQETIAAASTSPASTPKAESSRPSTTTASVAPQFTSPQFTAPQFAASKADAVSAKASAPAGPTASWATQSYPSTDDPLSVPAWLIAARARNANRVAAAKAPVAQEPLAADRPATATSYSETLQASRTASPGYQSPGGVQSPAYQPSGSRPPVFQSPAYQPSEARANGAMSLDARAPGPDTTRAAMANYPDAVRPADAGAQFEGTIQTPTFGNNYDRNGSSVR
jgi:hypothetical protein